MSGKFTVVQGEDRIIPLDVVRKTNTNIKRPFNLEGWTKLAVQFRRSNSSVLELDSIPAFGRQAFINYEGVLYTASNVGVSGNAITLVFDGIDDIATVLNAWNVANSGDPVTSDAEDDSVVPVSGTVVLTGGLDDYAKVTVIGDAGDGKIQVQLDNEDTNSLKIGSGQGVAVVVDFGDHDLGNRRIASAKNVINVEKPSL